MKNKLFGKTCEDVRKYTDIRIVSHEKGIDKLTKKQEFKRLHIYNENLAAVLMEKMEVKLNKPRLLDQKFFPYPKHSCMTFITIA